MLTANMKLIAECADKLAHLGEKLFNETEMETFRIGQTTEFSCPDGYEFRDENGNLIDTTKIRMTKKKQKYPETYEECTHLTGYSATCNFRGYRPNLIVAFQKLLICRDAYWELAGDWKPDYDSGCDKFGICTYDGVVQKSNAVSHWERHLNKILEFPTEEMRDAFYENFKELIEECKELL